MYLSCQGPVVGLRKGVWPELRAGQRSGQWTGRPERALKAFSQWRSSWLSREAWAAAAALGVAGLYALLLIFAQSHIMLLGWLTAILALATVYATSMIYAQLKTVPRWNHWSTTALFLILSLTGGALLSGRVTAALILLILSAAAQIAWWIAAEKRETHRPETTASATGLTHGKARPFEAPHSGGNYLTHEMGYVVARRHARKLRALSLVLGSVLPAALLAIAPNHLTAGLALLSHIIGTLSSRWLFFAEAQHSISLYYPHTSVTEAQHQTGR